MDQRVKSLVEQGNRLFEKRGNLLSMWQDIAENYYVERADFTASRNLGDTFADHLTTSYPLLVRRDLGNSLSAMLRPKETNWFNLKTTREEREDKAAREWLEWATGVQKRAMYDRATQFVRATKEGDHDFATFGQCVISVELDRRTMTLLYRCWHLRDVAWRENYAGKIDTIHRNWKPEACDLVALFGKNVHPKVKDLVENDGGKAKYQEVECRHVIIPADQYEGKWRTPYVSLHIDVDNEHVMEATGSWGTHYVIPRWQTVSGSQYAYSPAVVACMPDGRLLQAITLSLLEASEKASNPPMIGVQEAIRGDVDLQAGGYTPVDADYDERLGEVLRPITQDFSGIRFGIEMSDRVAALIKEAFYLNQISPVPRTNKEMTAFEVAQHMQDYIRKALPLFEPMEQDYNGALCDATFDILLRNHAFGDLRELPKSLSGADITFRFVSPLHDVEERKKANLFLESRGLVVAAAETDPVSATMLNTRTALRDALKGLGTPEAWTRADEEMQAIERAMQEKQAAAEMLAAAGQAGVVAEQFGKASQALTVPQQAA